LGEALQGVEHEPSGIPIDFKKVSINTVCNRRHAIIKIMFLQDLYSMSTTPYCEVGLNEEKLKA
jgi:hypothetical protein